MNLWDRCGLIRSTRSGRLCAVSVYSIMPLIYFFVVWPFLILLSSLLIYLMLWNGSSRYWRLMVVLSPFIWLFCLPRYIFATYVPLVLVRRRILLAAPPFLVLSFLKCLAANHVFSALGHIVWGATQSYILSRTVIVSAFSIVLAPLRLQYL